MLEDGVMVTSRTPQALLYVPENRSIHSFCGIYMFYGGINYEPRGQWSCVRSHSCPTVELQQTQSCSHTFMTKKVTCEGAGGLRAARCWFLKSY